MSLQVFHGQVLVLLTPPFTLRASLSSKRAIVILLSVKTFLIFLAFIIPPDLIDFVFIVKPNHTIPAADCRPIFKIKTFFLFRSGENFNAKMPGLFQISFITGTLK